MTHETSDPSGRIDGIREILVAPGGPGGVPLWIDAPEAARWTGMVLRNGGGTLGEAVCDAWIAWPDRRVTRHQGRPRIRDLAAVAPLMALFHPVAPETAAELVPATVRDLLDGRFALGDEGWDAGMVEDLARSVETEVAVVAAAATELVWVRIAAAAKDPVVGIAAGMAHIGKPRTPQGIALRRLDLLATWSKARDPARALEILRRHADVVEAACSWGREAREVTEGLLAGLSEPRVLARAATWRRRWSPGVPARRSRGDRWAGDAMPAWDRDRFAALASAAEVVARAAPAAHRAMALATLGNLTVAMAARGQIRAQRARQHVERVLGRVWEGRYLIPLGRARNSLQLAVRERLPPLATLSEVAAAAAETRAIRDELPEGTPVRAHVEDAVSYLAAVEVIGQALDDLDLGTFDPDPDDPPWTTTKGHLWWAGGSTTAAVEAALASVAGGRQGALEKVLGPLSANHHDLAFVGMEEDSQEGIATLTLAKRSTKFAIVWTRWRSPRFAAVEGARATRFLGRDEFDALLEGARNTDPTDEEVVHQVMREVAGDVFDLRLTDDRHVIALTRQRKKGERPLAALCEVADVAGFGLHVAHAALPIEDLTRLGFAWGGRRAYHLMTRPSRRDREGRDVGGGARP